MTIDKTLTLHAMRLLLVDENVMTQNFTAEQLKKLDHTVRVDMADRGKKNVLRLADNHRYDLIIVQIDPPNILEGDTVPAHIAVCDIVQAIKQSVLNKDTPIFALGAHTKEEHKEAYLNCGVVDILTEPMTYEMGLKVVVEWVLPKKQRGFYEELAKEAEDG